MAEPRAWGKKYLIAPSLSWKDLEEIIIGINESIFSSNDAQINSQLVLDSAINVLRINVDKDNK